MFNIEEIYRNLTNVDINQQKLLWDERGKGYYGEFLVFCELYPHLPGNCKILMNINIPTVHGKTTEIDLLLLHESGLYVFEMKHYKGTIYGKPHEQNWTQYFRTAPNQRFRSPIAQNQYHIDALKKIVPDIPIHSYIVFTSDECDLRVECNTPGISVCTLSSLRHELNDLSTAATLLSMEQIDLLFRTLLAYSPTAQHKVSVEGNEMPFHEFLSELCANYAVKEKQLNAAYENQKKKSQIASRISILTAALVALATIAISIVVCISYNKYSTAQITAAQQELAAFAQKFEHVGPYNNGNITMETDFIKAYDVRISQSADVKNTVNLQFSLQWNGEYYGANISRDTKIIVILKDGSVKEYDLLESSFPHTSSNIRLGKGNSWYSAYSTREFPVHELSGIHINDISYIKLSVLDIWVTEDSGYKPVIIGTGYEVLVYEH